MDDHFDQRISDSEFVRLAAAARSALSPQELDDPELAAATHALDRFLVAAQDEQAPVAPCDTAELDPRARTRNGREVYPLLSSMYALKFAQVTLRAFRALLGYQSIPPLLIAIRPRREAPSRTSNTTSTLPTSIGCSTFMLIRLAAIMET
jgi:hypothetical protein